MDTYDNGIPMWNQTPITHEPWCERFDPHRTDTRGLLPCHCGAKPESREDRGAAPLDPLLERQFGSGDVDLSAWLECVDNHDRLCPALHYEDDEACLCLLIARVRTDEKARIGRWIAHRHRLPDITPPGAANFDGPFDDLPNELMWQHGEVGVDRDGFVFCRRCGASGSDVDDLLTTPCNEPHPLWMDLAS